MQTPPDTDKSALRMQLKQRRAGVSDSQQRQACEAIARHLVGSALWPDATRIALYLPHNAEISPLAVADAARDAGKTLFLPVVGDNHTLCFKAWPAGSELRPNRFGIPEPAAGGPVLAEALDCILVPLLGWNRRGVRLGMGGGYYDRALAAISDTTLVGVGYACQECDTLSPEAWDVSMNYILTEQTLIACD